MTKENFLVVKRQLTLIILEYEFLNRKSNFLKNNYLLEFHNEIATQQKLLKENEYMFEAIKLKADGKSLDEIKKYLENAKEEFLNLKFQFASNYKHAQELEKRCDRYTLEDIQQLDSLYADFCKLYHPVIKGKSSEKDQYIYSTLTTLYRSGNIEGFKSLLDENKDSLVENNYDENEYEGIAYMYNQSITNLTKKIDEMKKDFPLTKEEVLASDEGITNELAFLRQSNYNLMEMNKDIHLDFKLNFNFDFEL